MTLDQDSFITNKGKLLTEIIDGILPKSESVDILVGYFFFSGYERLAEKLKDHQIRILVGLDIDQDISKAVRIINTLSENKKSFGQLREEFYEQFVNMFNMSNFLDCEEKLKPFKAFCEKIKNGTLEVRKTQEACHSKLYIFNYNPLNNENGECPGDVIMGSSNLSYTGLEGRLEINARFRDKHHHQDAKQIFESLWASSVEVINSNLLPEWEEKVIKKIWYEKLFPPHLIFLRVLHEYFDSKEDQRLLTPSDLTNGTYSNLKYQTDAVQLGMTSLKNHNGVIISDVVGLGKSVIASTIASNLKLKTIVVSPPHLVKQWESYKTDFAFNATIFSCGKLSEALNFFIEKHTKDEQFLIIIDEAHRFRNDSTKDYSILHELCANNKVILLTATPFNNRPADIYSLVKLFQLPNISTLKTVENLGETFRSLVRRYKELEKNSKKKKSTDQEIQLEAEEIAAQIRSIINPLVVRRSRLDLQAIPAYKKDLKEQGYSIVIPEDPLELYYPISSDFKALYLRTLNKIASENPELEVYKSARYQPATYILPEKQKELELHLKETTGMDFQQLLGGQRNVAKFMRRMLVQRLESSLYAFKKSLESMISSAEQILNWAHSVKLIPIYKRGELPDAEEFFDITEEGIEEKVPSVESYKKKGLFTIPLDFLHKDFCKHVESDISLLKQIRKEWFEETQMVDPKLKEFASVLSKRREEDPARKILVFSAFADTVNYLASELKKSHGQLKVLSYTSQDAFSGKKELIRVNFDAGLKEDLQKDDFDILIATDAISEGYNLHRAGTIINYDIPYNPTRVIQRIGRINRINKKVFSKLYVMNYFPSEVGEAETRTKEISTLKMAMIHAVMGEDTKALTKEEEVRSFFKEKYRKELSKNEILSWDTPYRAILEKFRGTDIYRSALSIPLRSRIARKVMEKEPGVLIFGKKGTDFVFKFSTSDAVRTLDAEKALSLFACSMNLQNLEPSYKVDDKFDGLYQKGKEELFSSQEKTRNDPNIAETLKKIRVLQRTNIGDKSYLDDLQEALKTGGLSSREIVIIKNLSPKEFSKLNQIISPSYLLRILKARDSVEAGEETLILSEQLIQEK